MVLLFIINWGYIMDINNSKLIIGSILSVLIGGDTALGMMQNCKSATARRTHSDFWHTAEGTKIIQTFNGETPTLTELNNFIDTVMTKTNMPAPSRNERRNMPLLQNFIHNNWECIDAVLGIIAVADTPHIPPCMRRQDAHADETAQRREGRVNKMEYYRRLQEACGEETAKAVQNCFDESIPLSPTELFDWLDCFYDSDGIRQCTNDGSTGDTDTAAIYRFVSAHLSDILQTADTKGKWYGIDNVYERPALNILLELFPQKQHILQHSAYAFADNLFHVFDGKYDGYGQALSSFRYVSRHRKRIWKYIVDNEQTIRNITAELMKNGCTQEELFSSRALRRKNGQ